MHLIRKISMQPVRRGPYIYPKPKFPKYNKPYMRNSLGSPVIGEYHFLYNASYYLNFSTSLYLQSDLIIALGQPIHVQAKPI